MGENQVSVKDTKEMIKGVLMLAAILSKKFADGVQATDAAEVWAKFQTDEQFKTAMLDAYNGANNISEEIGDLSVAEAFELAGVLVQEIPKLLEALK